jgi:uncharacterized protein YigE (DUF2233 family)
VTGLCQLAFGILLLLCCANASALEAERIVRKEKHYTVCRVDLDQDRLRLYWKGPDNEIYRNFGRLKKDLETQGEQLEFATNAGMYQEDRKPLGLCISHGRILHPINLRKGRGNFYLRPNGIFLVDDDGAHVLESRDFVKREWTPRLATQSGPLLVIDGEIHPVFEKNSVSRKLRSGVGVRSDGRVVFAISDDPVNFHEFAELFLNRLECPNALFLDGTISRMYVPGLQRMDLGGDFGPILGVISRKN